MKNKMTKKEIQEIKKQAKNRKNRRLNDLESSRLLTLATTKLGLRDSKEDWPVSDLNTIDKASVEVRAEVCEVRLPKPVASLHVSAKVQSDVKAKPVVRKSIRSSKNFENKHGLFTIGSGWREAGMACPRSNANRRLSEKQYKKLMKIATKELGLDEKNNIGVLDLNHFEEDYFGEEKPLQRVIDSLLSRGHGNLIEEYMSIVHNKKIRRLGDKLSVINYLLHKPLLNERTPAGEKARVTFKMPTCLISKKDRVNKSRNYDLCPMYKHPDNVNNRRLHKWGNIKDHPFRVIPDEEYFLEINGYRNIGKRTKFDAFDRMNQDKKIEWARAANLITRIGTDDIVAIKNNVKSESDVDVALFAMKYACKVTDLPEFQGRFKNPYWILYRIIRYHMEMTSKENGLFCKMSTGYASLSPKKTIPIINEKTAIQRLIPTLMKLKVYKDFVKQSGDRKTRSELALAKKLILGIKDNA